MDRPLEIGADLGGDFLVRRVLDLVDQTGPGIVDQGVQLAMLASDDAEGPTHLLRLGDIARYGQRAGNFFRRFIELG